MLCENDKISLIFIKDKKEAKTKSVITSRIEAKMKVKFKL